MKNKKRVKARAILQNGEMPKKLTQKKIRGKKVKPLIAYIYTENLQNGWKGNDGAMFIYRRIKIPKKEGFTKVKIITYTLNIKK